MVRRAELSLGAIVNQGDVEAIARELQRKDRLKRGRVTRMELGEALEDLGYNNDANLRAKLKNFDRDGTGTVAFEEMLDFIEKESADYVRAKVQRRIHRLQDASVLSRLIQLLKERDDQMNGMVTRWQFRAALADVGISVNVDELRCIVDQLDRTGTNHVPYGSFLHFIRVDASGAVSVDPVEEERAQEALRRLRKDAGIYGRRQLLSHLRRLATEDDLLFREELQDAAHDLGAHLSPGEMEALLAHLDPHCIGIEPEALAAELLEGEGVEGHGEAGLILSALRRCIRETKVSFRQFQALAKEEAAEVARDNLRKAVHLVENERQINLLRKLQELGHQHMTARELFDALMSLGVIVQEEDVHASILHIGGEAGITVPVEQFAAFAGSRTCAEEGQIDESLCKLRHELAPKGRSALMQHFDQYDGRRHGYLFKYAFEEALSDLGLNLSPAESSLLAEHLGRGGLIYLDHLIDTITEGAAVTSAPKGESGVASLKALRSLLREAREAGLKVLRIFYQARFRACQEPCEIVLSQQQLTSLRRLLRRQAGIGDSSSASKLGVREATTALELQDLYRQVLKPNLHRFDRAGDGRVDIDEMLDFLEEQGARYIRLLIIRLLSGEEDEHLPFAPWCEEDAPCDDNRALLRAFERCDSKAKGTITRWQFQCVLEDCGIYLAPEECLSLCDYLDPDASNSIRYRQFLSYIGVLEGDDEDAWSPAGVMDGLRSDLGAYASSRLLSHFRRFDARAEGHLPRWLFDDSLADIGVRLTSPESHVLAKIFSSSSGALNYERFVSVLLDGMEPKFTLEGLSRLVRRASNGVDLLGAFSRYDRRLCGEICESDFVQAMRDMGISLTRADAAVFISEFSGDRQGWVKYGNFVRLIESPGARVSGRRISQQDRLDVLIARIRHGVEAESRRGERSRIAVRKMLGVSSGSTISTTEFRSILRDLGLGMTVDEMQVLEEHLDKTRNGRISKDDFLAALGQTSVESLPSSSSPSVPTSIKLSSSSPPRAGGVGWNPARRRSAGA
jgi:Ca2+-binding EF-hand superfamily protein